MQKHILLCICILLHTFLHAMEYTRKQPSICIEQTDISLDSLLITLSKEYPDIPYIGSSQEDILSHQSKLLTTVHSQRYLESIEKHPSIMRSAITNTLLPAFYPNQWSHSYFDNMLKQCAITTVATKVLIDQIDKQKPLPHYAISLGEAYSFAGYAQGSNGHAYAAIPMAVTYAINTEMIQRILIIDENISQKELLKEYYDYGNGSIFYAKNNPQLIDFFKKKIITSDKLSCNNLWSFTKSNAIDLIFYHMNMQDNDHTKNKRTLNIFSLFHNAIPTIFILSGDKKIYQETTYYIIDYIINTAKAAALQSKEDDPNYDTHETSSSSKKEYEK